MENKNQLIAEGYVSEEDAELISKVKHCAPNYLLKTLDN